MFGKNYRLASSELCALTLERRLLILVSVTFLTGILVAASYTIQKYFTEMQTKEYLAFTAPWIIAASLMAYTMIIFSLPHIKVLKKGSNELDELNINYFLDMENSMVSGVSATCVQIGTYIQKLVQGIGQTSRKLFDIRKYLDLITIATHDAIFVTDDMGKIEYANESFLDLSGFVEDEIVGRHMNTFFSPHEDCLFQLKRNNAENCNNNQLDTSLLLKTGARKHVAMRYGHVEIYSTKKLICVVKNIQDSQKVDEIKNNIVSNISHELRTPLTIIKGFIEIASEEENREKRNKYLQKSLEALKRQEWMIEDLLTVAMNEEDIKAIVYDCVYLHDVVEKAVEKVISKAREADIEIKNMIKHGTCVKADPDKLCYAITKLLDNAIKFNNPGEDVIIEAASSEELITVKVVDRGIGIAPEDLDRVFDRFYQRDTSSKRRYGGNGLGLTVAKRIIEHHGGKIWVESEKNKGSTFFFTLHGFTRKTL